MSMPGTLSTLAVTRQLDYLVIGPAVLPRERRRVDRARRVRHDLVALRRGRLRARRRHLPLSGVRGPVLAGRRRDRRSQRPQQPGAAHLADAAIEPRVAPWRLPA